MADCHKLDSQPSTVLPNQASTTKRFMHLQHSLHPYNISDISLQYFSLSFSFQHEDSASVSIGYYVSVVARYSAPPFVSKFQ